MAIKFGTSGWRAVIAEEFTFANLRQVCRAIAKYLINHHLREKGIIVGYDTRFLSREFAKACAREIAADTIKVYLTERDTPTPVISLQILNKQAAGAINITASHNPPQYNGIKFSSAYGGPAPLEVTREIEQNIQAPASLQHQVGCEETIVSFDPRPAYFKRIKQLVDFSVIRRARLKIGVDVLYGTGRGYLDQLLQDAGSRIVLLHGRPDPLFGGLSPEPARPQMGELIHLVRSKRMHLGLALDGDADRFGVIDRDGTYIGANQVFSLLTEHLILTRPRKKRIARTVATTHMVDALAQREGIQVVQTPVGFKYIGQQIAKGDCLIGGEESGGLSIAGHVPEKDGILACLLIAELVAVRKKSLAAILKELHKKVGPLVSARQDFHFRAQEKEALVNKIESLAQKPSLFGKKIAKFIGMDGYKFIFADSSWIMFRVSGTEPVIRCYAESRSKRQLQQLINQGKALIKKRLTIKGK